MPFHFSMVSDRYQSIVNIDHVAGRITEQQTHHIYAGVGGTVDGSAVLYCQSKN